MSRINGLNGFGQAQSVAPSGLARVAAGWTDTDMVTIRKMAKEGATAEEMAEAVGWTKGRVVRFIRNNKLVWNNRVRGDLNRHITYSAAAISTHMQLGHKVGNKRQLLSPEERAEAAKRAWATRRANGNAPPPKADRDGMLNLIIRLHVEEVLSEGQVAKATGLDRVSIRKLADDYLTARAA